MMLHANDVVKEHNIKKTIEKKQCAEKGTLLFLLCDCK